MMDITVHVLEEYEKEEYEKYILQKEDTLLYASTKYRYLLEELLNDQSLYLIASENHRIVGVLPCFIKQNSKYGNVLNSLPFYGSTGAMVCDGPYIREKLLEAYYKLSEKYNCVASTMITSPFENENEWYVKQTSPQFIDKRIGQVTIFPSSEGDDEQGLFYAIDSKTRNIIKKAQKSGVTVEIDNSCENMDFLYECHVEGMKKIGGLAKKKKFFELVAKIFEPGEEYNIFTAKLEGKKIASCLLLYYNNTVEYFVPVTLEGYRSCQPLSLIIYEGMKEAVRRGYKRWNWGGTWMTQKGVYEFKRKWATTDFMYYYYVNIFDFSILDIKKEEILSEYENYYVYPFQIQEAGSE